MKTALHGGDPNWGRILAAVGRSGVDLDIERRGHPPRRRLGGARAARARAYDEATRARGRARGPRAHPRATSHAGAAAGWMWTCDLSRGYVDINAHYRS